MQRKTLKKRVDLRSSDIIQNNPWAETLWLDLYVSLFVRKRKQMYLAPCVEGMVAFRHDAEMHEEQAWEEEMDRDQRVLQQVTKDGYDIELGKETYNDNITIGQDYLTRANIEPILLIYMRRRGFDHNEVKFVWHRTDLVIWPT